jgi:hypothetical protein
MVAGYRLEAQPPAVAGLPEEAPALRVAAP